MLLQVVNEPQIKGISTLFGLVETNITREHVMVTRPVIQSN